MRIFDSNPSAAEPLSLESVKAFLRVDGDHEDALLESLIRLAREQIEGQVCLSLIARKQTYERELPAGRSLYLNRYPIQTIEEIRIITNSETLVIDSSAYRANIKARPVPITLTSGQDWSAAFPNAQGLEVDFVAGFGEAPEDIPMPLRQAMLLLIAQSFEHRGDTDTSPLMMVDALLMPYKGMRL